jgi:dephospho-CoA kinase
MKALGVNVYELPETVQAHVLVQQIEEYTKAHFWVSVLSLESLHRFASIAEVKLILGSLLHIVYVETSKEERVRRQISRVGPDLAEAKIAELERKDATKVLRGAARVHDIADTVLDNNGSLDDMRTQLRALLATLST